MYTPEQQRRNTRIAYALVIPFAILCVGISVWMVGRAFDHMTDPCRTHDLRSMSPACK